MQARMSTCVVHRCFCSVLADLPEPGLPKTTNNGICNAIVEHRDNNVTTGIKRTFIDINELQPYRCVMFADCCVKA